MSIESQIGSTSGATTGTATSGPSSTSSSSGSGIASGDPGVKQTAAQVKDQAVEQTKAVASEAKQHVSSVVGQTRDEVRQQVQQRSQQLSTSLEGLAGQLRSLRSGRPEEAGSLHHYLVDAEQKVSGWAQRLQEGGPDMVLRDVRTFARRKPGTFLLAALGAGFVAGRMVRVGAAAAHDQQQSSGMTSGFASNAYPIGSTTDPASGMPLSRTIDPAIPAAGSEAFA